MRRVWSGFVARVQLRPEAQLHSDARRKMVVGLGNPGMDGTRHNVGRAVLDRLALRLGAAGRWRGDGQINAELIVCNLDPHRAILIKPKLLMNRNGAAVAKAVQKFGVRPEDVLLVHDDLDKPLGKIALKLGGSARGHNGVRSCVHCLNTDVMRRVRVGIGRPSGHTSVDKHVLGHFSPDQRKVLDSVLVQSVDLLLSLLSPPGGAADTPQQPKQNPPPGGAADTPQQPKQNPPPGGAADTPQQPKQNPPPGGAADTPQQPKQNPPPGGAADTPQQKEKN